MIRNNQTMKQMAMILLLAVVGGGIARADDDCHVPMEQWQPREAVQAMAAGRGWTVARIKVDDGCYGIRGTDVAGRAFKAKIDPATLEIVKLRYRDRSDGHHGSRRGRTRNDGTGAVDETPANGSFEMSAPPQAVEK